MDNSQLSPNEKEQVVNYFKSFESTDSLNIAIIGKTGVGKSSFINAFRNLTSGDKGAAEEKPGAESCKIDPSSAKYSYPIKIAEVEIQINFFDTMGFMDDQNRNVDTFLQELQEEHKISEFDAIIFMTENRLSDQELKIAKQKEEKNVLLFFVYNKIDYFLQQKIKKLTGTFSSKKSFEEQFNQNKTHLTECLDEEKDALYKLIDRKRVFGSLMQENESFQSTLLKEDKYREKVVKKSIYFIISNVGDFLDENYSKDGIRLKEEIEKHLIHAKLNGFSIDLSDQFSERLIRLKKKYLLSNLFDGTATKLKMAGNSLINLIPGLDTLLGHLPYLNEISEREMVNHLKKDFRKKFGIDELQNKLSSDPDLISNNKEKIQNLKNIFIKIDKDEIINCLDLVAEQLNNIGSPNIKQRIKEFLVKLFSINSVSIAMAQYFDDLLRALPFLSKISTSFVSLVAIVSVPVAIIIFIFFLKKTFEKILIRYEEYALLIFELLHEST